MQNASCEALVASGHLGREAALASSSHYLQGASTLVEDHHPPSIEVDAAVFEGTMACLALVSRPVAVTGACLVGVLDQLQILADSQLAFPDLHDQGQVEVEPSAFLDLVALLLLVRMGEPSHFDEVGFLQGLMVLEPIAALVAFPCLVSFGLALWAFREEVAADPQDRSA
jgi:hypothetical protein